MNKIYTIMNKSNEEWKGDVLYPISLFSVACLILLLSSFSTKSSYDNLSNIRSTESTLESNLESTSYGIDQVEISTCDLEIVPEFNLSIGVSLVSFTGRYVENRKRNTINWITPSGVNTDHFILERSIANGAFVAITKVDAKSNGSVEALYSFNDIDVALNGNYSYRLKQISNEGSESYSDILSIDVQKIRAEPTVKVFPSPAYDIVNVAISKEESDVVSVKLFDLRGKAIDLNNVKVVANGSQAKLQIPAENIPRAAYILRVNIGDQVFAKKITLAD